MKNTNKFNIPIMKLYTNDVYKPIYNNLIYQEEFIRLNNIEKMIYYERIINHISFGISIKIFKKI